jgi:hypothetical protein
LALLKPSKVDFNADAATFQLQIVMVVWADAGAAASRASDTATPVILKHIENLPFSIAVLKRTCAE